MATGAPGTNGVWQYGEDDSEATFSALLNKAASTTDTQLGLDRARLTTLEARKKSGLIPIIPTSVTATGGSGSHDSTTGLITFGAGTTSLTVNGVFTSAYKNYRMVFNCTKNATAGNDAVQWRLTASGTATSSGYYQAAIGIAMSNGAIQNLGGSGATALYMTRIYQASVKSVMSLDIYSPQAAEHTEISGTGYGTTLGDDQTIVSAGRMPNNTQYDGVYIFPTGNTISGTVSFYAYED